MKLVTFASIKDNLATWNKFNGILITILLVVIIVCTISIIYNKKVRNYNIDDKMPGFLVLVNVFVASVENIVVSILGKKYQKLTPYIMYLFAYIFIGCLLSILGLEAQGTSFTVTLSMGMVTFIMIYYFGIKYQKLAFFKRFRNPVELFTQFTPLISISFRLFGNLIGGSIILGLLYGLLIGFQLSWGVNNIQVDGMTRWASYAIWNPELVENGYLKQYEYWWAGLNLFTTPIMPFLHMYFDLFSGVIQSTVFAMLTLSYWSAQIDDNEKRADLVDQVKEEITNKYQS
ncbi:F0F1 ATP synthase subunit A [Mycoplasma mycoides]|uniref:F0F1 ATP synthase subunit A n=1 Tax=Mycoplasma mycoides TaxID=2102 RepID=UPI00224069A9|nr:F0F1 ATP synthase subunit A [Mycoplasma mycoides]QVJ95390.1 F0F1 ATP synthase subunit A [Mycoplasma mycoides subsp. capri]QVK06725.1 F0F1 ATP synthase subunit A [Mycoplasma mycoides subsp. capri]